MFGRAAATLAILALAATPITAQADIGAESEGSVTMGNLPFYYDLYTFRGDGGATLVVASFAVAAGALEARRGHADVRYRFDVSLVLADTATGTIYRSDDSVFVAAAHHLGDEHLLFTYAQILAPPSTSVVHRAIMNDATTPGVGQLYRAPFRVPDYRGDSLMLSDIALGQPDTRAGWARGDAIVALLPTSRFPASSFDVYYEIYNLPEDRPYTTEVWVEPAADAVGVGAGTGAGAERTVRNGAAVRRTPDPDAVALRFSDEARPRADGAVPELRRIDASLRTGRYRLTIVVTDDETGETARSTRLFDVRGRNPGATLITALPRSGPPQ